MRAKRNAMLTIRNEQMAVCSKAMIDDFEVRMMAHLRKHFPEPYSSLGDSTAREMIRYGMQQAALYEIRGERDLCKYIDLTMVLGKDFDQQLPWVSKVLNDRGSSPDIRICRLYERVMNPQK
jgi:hypothetical protein